jgi:hypothetical protein
MSGPSHLTKNNKAKVAERAIRVYYITEILLQNRFRNIKYSQRMIVCQLLIQIKLNTCEDKIRNVNSGSLGYTSDVYLEMAQANEQKKRNQR